MALGRRVAIFGLSLLFAFGAQVGAAAGAERVHASVGFEPIPLSLAADAAGHVYLSDPLSGTVLQYTSEGELLGNLNDFASSGNPFEPRGIATDAAGAVYVADAPAGEIVVLGAGGGVLRNGPSGAVTTSRSASTVPSTWRRCAKSSASPLMAR